VDNDILLSLFKDRIILFRFVSLCISWWRQCCEIFLR